MCNVRWQYTPLNAWQVSNRALHALNWPRHVQRYIIFATLEWISGCYITWPAITPRVCKWAPLLLKNSVFRQALRRPCMQLFAKIALRYLRPFGVLNTVWIGYERARGRYSGDGTSFSRWTSNWHTLPVEMAMAMAGMWVRTLHV